MGLLTPREILKNDLFSKGTHILEIGCGNGEFLLHLHQARPYATIWGLDISNFALKKAFSRTKDRANIFLVKSDGKWFLQWLVPPQTLKEIYLLFPDPWPGNEKKRMVNQNFLKLLSERLEIGGRFTFATDVRDYFEKTRELIESSGFFGITEGMESFYTKYERKWKSLRRETYSLTAELVEAPKNIETFKVFLEYPVKVSISVETIKNLAGLELRRGDTFFKIIDVYEKTGREFLFKTVFRFRDMGQKQLFILKDGKIDLLPVQLEIYPEPLLEAIKLVFT